MNAKQKAVVGLTKETQFTRYALCFALLACAITLDMIVLWHMHEDHFDRMVEQMNSALLNSTF
jgi:hypothetical protein